MIWAFLRPLVWCLCRHGDGDDSSFGDGYFGHGNGNGSGEGYNYGHGAGDHCDLGSDFYGGRG